MEALLPLAFLGLGSFRVGSYRTNHEKASKAGCKGVRAGRLSSWAARGVTVGWAAARFRKASRCRSNSGSILAPFGHKKEIHASAASEDPRSQIVTEAESAGRLHPFLGPAPTRPFECLAESDTSSRSLTFRSLGLSPEFLCLLRDNKG